MLTSCNDAEGLCSLKTIMGFVDTVEEDIFCLFGVSDILVSDVAACQSYR